MGTEQMNEQEDFRVTLQPYSLKCACGSCGQEVAPYVSRDESGFTISFDKLKLWLQGWCPKG